MKIVMMAAAAALLAVPAMAQDGAAEQPKNLEVFHRWYLLHSRRSFRMHTRHRVHHWYQVCIHQPFHLLYHPSSQVSHLSVSPRYPV